MAWQGTPANKFCITHRASKRYYGFNRNMEVLSFYIPTFIKVNEEASTQLSIDSGFLKARVREYGAIPDMVARTIWCSDVISWFQTLSGERVDGFRKISGTLFWRAKTIFQVVLKSSTIDQTLSFHWFKSPRISQSRYEVLRIIIPDLPPNCWEYALDSIISFYYAFPLSLLFNVKATSIVRYAFPSFLL